MDGRLKIRGHGKQISAALGLVILIIVTYRSRKDNASPRTRHENDDENPTTAYMIPRPKGSIPYIGHLFAIGKNPRKTFLQWHHELGPIFGLELGVQPWIMIGRADIAYDILHKERNSTSGKPYYRLLSEFYSCEEKGIVFSQPTPSWRQARAAVLSVLSPKKLENELGDVLEREADELIDILVTGHDIDPTNHLLRASLNFILIACFNKRTSSIDDPLFTTLTDLLQSCIAHSDIVKYHIGAFLPILSMLNRWTGTEQAFANLLKNQRNPFYMQLIQEALGSDTDCLAKILMVREKLDAEYVIASLNDMVIAGSDTTTVTLGWAFNILCTRPDVQEKIQQELDAFMNKYKRLPTFSERNQVPYLIAVQKECMRFRPTTPCGAPHLVEQDVEWRGNIIPKGTTIVANMIAIHSNPDTFPEPKIFRPERFLDKLEPMSILATKKIGERDHFNFGWGRRVCPGIALAEIQLFNVFTRVFSRCIIMPPSSGEKIDLDIYFSGGVGAIAAPPRTPLRFVASQKIIEQRESLPTFDYKNELIEAIREYSVLVVIGETGSGKTTQIPQYILEGMPELKKIGVTQPRRIAAITVAKRVSEEQGVRLGSTVGYTIRFDDTTSPDTKLKYMTDGVLLREATEDPQLSQYSVVVIDEAHERTLETDVLFGLLKKTQRLRPDLKILIMSATLDVEKFSDFFEECPIFEIPGRTFPVDVVYYKDAQRLASLKSNLVDHAVEAAWHIHTQEPAGDLLVFLTGQNDIERACRAFQERAGTIDYKKTVRFYEEGVRDIAIYPLYASLETYDQKAVFEAPKDGVRKVVFATNVAQTSVTIPGIRYVIDSGFVKEKTYDANTGMDALLVTEISQAAATQRAGRAGRTAPGKAYRLYTADSYNHMLADTIPEIQRSSLLGTVLSLKKMGIVDVVNFEFIDPPDEKLVRNALKQLYLLGAIDEIGKLTPLGDKMSYFPLSPSLARVLVSSAEEYECSHEVLTIASILAGENDLFRAPSARSRGGQRAVIEAEECKLRFAHHAGDHMTYLNVWHEWKRHSKSRSWCKDNWINSKVLETAANVRRQLVDVMDKARLPIKRAPRWKQEKKSSSSSKRRTMGDDENGRQVDPVPILKSFLSGYFTNIANKGANRAVFSHYSPDQHLTEGMTAEVNDFTGSPTSLVALHLHPLCAFSDMLDRNRIRYSELDWVMYMHVTYTNKAVMKGVSKILWDWIKAGEGRERIRKLPKTRLNGEDAPNVLEMDHDAEAEKAKLEDEKIMAEIEQDKRKRRAAEIEEIRQRALARRKIQ